MENGGRSSRARVLITARLSTCRTGSVTWKPAGQASGPRAHAMSISSRAKAATIFDCVSTRAPRSTISTLKPINPVTKSLIRDVPPVIVRASAFQR